jgi:hypothetical protein
MSSEDELNKLFEKKLEQIKSYLNSQSSTELEKILLKINL